MSLTTIEKKVDEILEILNGEGDKPGIKGRLILVEQSLSLHKKIFWFLFTTSIGSLSTFLFYVIFR